MQSAQAITIKITCRRVDLIDSHPHPIPVDLDALYGIKSLANEGHSPHSVSLSYHVGDVMVHLDTMLDPRLDMHHAQSEEHSSSGGMPLKPEGYLHLLVPTAAHALTITWGLPSGRQTQVIDIQGAPKFTPQDSAPATGGPAVRLYDLEQWVGSPSRHRSFVFLSAGYTEQEKPQFKAAVAAAIAFMGGDLSAGPSTLMPTPWDRYMPLINVFVVWQPSVESGATIPLKSDGTPHDGYSGAVPKASNLNCVYGADILRYLSCDLFLMGQLAFNSTPAVRKTTNTIALVNSAVYGGTGGHGFTSVYSGIWKQCAKSDGCVPVCTTDDTGCPGGNYTYWRADADNKFLKVLIHEIGHADAQLADEYDYQTTATTTAAMPNCNKDADNVPWAHWIGHPLGVMQPTVKGGFCSYTGYYKPTPDLCIMNTDRPEYCAACAERLILSFYRDTKDLAAPRCPQISQTMMVVDGPDWYRIAMSSRFVGVTQTERDILTWYSHAHDASPSGLYPKCTNAEALARRVRLATDNVPSDQVLCSDANNKIPVRRDMGDIRHTWYWPQTAARAPTASSSPDTTIGAINANPWQLKDGRWQMTGHTSWSLPDADSGVTGPLAEVYFKGSQLGVGLHAFELVVQDQSDFVIKEAWPGDPRVGNMTYRTQFRVQVVNKSDAQYGHCTARLAVTASNISASTISQCTASRQKFTYCAKCDPGAICNDTYPYRPFEVQADVNAIVSSFEVWLIGLGGALVAGGIGALIIFWCVMGYCTSRSVKGVVAFSRSIHIVRYIMIGCSALCMLVALVVIILVAVYYSRVTAIAKLLLIAAAIIAAVLYFVTFIGFTAALYRSTVQLIINGVLLILVVVALLAIGAAAIYIGIAVQTDSAVWEEFLEDQWKLQVKDNPKACCSFQSTFHCSGFSIPCHNTFHEQCPINCDFTNSRYPNSCYGIFRSNFSRYYYPFGAGFLCITVALLVSLVMNWVLCCRLRAHNVKTTARLDTVPGGGQGHNDLVAIRCLRNLTDEEYTKLQREFHKFDKSGSGQLNATQLCAFYKAALGVQLSPTDAAMVIDRFDETGTGHISFPEFARHCGRNPASAWEK